ncbi:MAG: UvrD-helicase domain-containing protein [Planctomycetota bacterium]
MTGPLVTRILASAGSGKTFTLTSHYLRLVASGVDPGRILATTFSREAAAEIRDRVFMRAAQAVRKVEARHEIQGDSSVAIDEVAAQRMLRGLVDALPRLSIRTFDSFFAGVVQAFAKELGIGDAPRLLDAGEEVGLLRDALAIALDQGDPDALVETILSLNHGKVEIGVVQSCLRKVGEIVEFVGETAPDAWDWEIPPPVTTDRIDEVIARIDELIERPPAEGDKSAAKALATPRRKLVNMREVPDNQWPPKAFGVLVERAADGVPIEIRNKPVPHEVAAMAFEVVALLRIANQRAYARMTRAVRNLASAVAEVRGRLIEARRVMTFDDQKALLDPDRGDLPALDELWFRMDGRIAHVLLDEFQDTSVGQWRALSRLIGEIVAGGEEARSVMFVGDVKQSIYGWRKGEPRLLSELEDVLGGGVEVDDRRLLTSYRSSRAVIRFVNRLFSDLEAGFESKLENGADVRFGVRSWGSRFQQHETMRAKAEDPEGFVQLDVFEPSQDAQHVGIAYAVARVAEIRERRPWASIGVIVRMNKQIGAITEALRREGHTVRIVGRGGLLDSGASLLIVQALRLAQHPGDTAAAFDLLHSPFASIGPLADLPTDATSLRSRAAVLSRRLRAVFEEDGIAVVVDRWRRELHERLDGLERTRLAQIVACIGGLEQRADRTPGEIAELLKNQRVAHPARGDIAVMNIHQSKGLEFDAVILPNMDWSLVGQGSRSKIAWASPSSPTQPIPRVVRTIDESSRGLLPEMAEVCREATRREVEESMSLLYVAVTRARDELHVLAAPRKKISNGGYSVGRDKSVSAVLGYAWDLDGVDFPDGTRWVAVSRDGQPGRDDSIGERVAPSLATRSSLKLVAGSRRRGLPRAKRDQPVVRVGRVVDQVARERGIALHAGLALVGFLDDGAPTLGDLANAMRRSLPGAEWQALEGTAAECLGLMQRAGLRALLSRQHPGQTVRTELRVAHLDDDGLHVNVLDRVVFDHDAEGRCVGATIIDFKSDVRENADDLAIAELHRDQLSRYREALHQVHGLSREKIALRVFILESDREVEVDA